MSLFMPKKRLVMLTLNYFSHGFATGVNKNVERKSLIGVHT